MNEHISLDELDRRIKDLESRVAKLELERTGYIRRIGNDALSRSKD